MFHLDIPCSSRSFLNLNIFFTSSFSTYYINKHISANIAIFFVQKIKNLLNIKNILVRQLR